MSSPTDRGDGAGSPSSRAETWFHTRLDSLWDAGSDPIDDAEIQTYLAEHPEHLEAFASTRADLQAIANQHSSTITAAASRFRRGRSLVTVAAALILVTWTGKAWLGPGSTHSVVDPSQSHPSQPLRVVATKITQRTLTSPRSRTSVESLCRHETETPGFRIRITHQVHKFR